MMIFKKNEKMDCPSDAKDEHEYDDGDKHDYYREYDAGIAGNLEMALRVILLLLF